MSGIQPSGTALKSKYRSRVSFIPLRISATTAPGLHVAIPGCAAGGVAARKPSLVSLCGSCLIAAHSVANKRADRATLRRTAQSSASSVVENSIASDATAAALATAASASS